MTSFEKLGAFYLGSPFDPGKASPSPAPLLYDAKDLTTQNLSIFTSLTGNRPR